MACPPVDRLTRDYDDRLRRIVDQIRKALKCVETTGGSGCALPFGVTGPFTPPSSTDFPTNVGFSGRTLIEFLDCSTYIQDTSDSPGTPADFVSGRVAEAPASLFSMTLCLGMNLSPGSTAHAGIMLRNTDTGNFLTWGPRQVINDLASWDWRVCKYTDPETFDSAPFTDFTIQQRNALLMRVTQIDIGESQPLLFETSTDNVHWLRAFEGTPGDLLGSGIQEIGYYHNGFQVQSEGISGTNFFHAELLAI